jgi:hypothetical protein
MTLEKLLNTLLEEWRKPFGREKTLHISCYDKCKWMNCQWIHLDGWFMNEDSKKFRELVSKESWLWQFVCKMSVENNYNKEKWKVLTWKKFEDDKYQINWYSNWWWYIQDYEYRLIETALTDEDKLEQFLLDNIKIDE